MMKISIPQCPNCKKNLDRATSVGHNDPPIPGAITICIQCASVLVIEETMLLRNMSAAELKEIEQHHPKEFILIQTIVQSIKDIQSGHR